MDATARSAKRATAAPAATTKGPDGPSFDADRELTQLRTTIEGIDAISQEALGEIAAVARLVLMALEQPGRGVVQDEVIAKAIEAIWNKAQCTEDSINAEAESVGCCYVDESRRRRMTAVGIA